MSIEQCEAMLDGAKKRIREAAAGGRIASEERALWAGSLCDLSLLMRVLAGPWRRRTAVAREIMSMAQSLCGTPQLGDAELRACGASDVDIERLACAHELGRRALLVHKRGTSISAPSQAYEAVWQHLVASPRERFVTVALDVRNRPLRVVVVAEGSVDACPVDPREVFLPAVRERASGIIVAHNHPSGDPQPSVEDLALTERLCLAGELLAIPLLDHLVVAGGRSPSASGVPPGPADGAPAFVSLAERGDIVPGARARRLRAVDSREPVDPLAEPWPRR